MDIKKHEPNFKTAAENYTDAREEFKTYDVEGLKHILRMANIMHGWGQLKQQKMN